MKKVTPGSIVYAALMVCTQCHRIFNTLLTLFTPQFRHCISALDDWRTEDDLFDRCLFAQTLLDLLEDPNDSWTQDTLAWWNA